MTNIPMLPRPYRGLTARDLMTPAAALATVAPDWTLREVAELLTVRHVTGAPVLDGSTVAGVVAASDLLEFATTAHRETRDCAEPGTGLWHEEGEPAAPFFVSLGMDLGEELAAPFADAAGTERNAFDEHTADEVMSRRILSIPPGASVAEASRAMLRGGVHRLLVVEDERLVGLLSATDVLRAVAEGDGGPIPA